METTIASGNDEGKIMTSFLITYLQTQLLYIHKFTLFNDGISSITVTVIIAAWSSNKFGNSTATTINYL